MNRITAIMTAFLVLLLLASGFMAADNIRLSGERAAIAEELNRQNYDYALLTRQIENQQNALALLTQERDELLLQLQDYQPGVTPGADEAIAASPAPHSDKDANAAGTPSSPPASPGPVPAAPTVSPAANSGKSAEAASSPAPAYATKAPAFPDAVAVTEDIFSSVTPGPSTAPAFQHPAPDDTILRQQLSDLTVDTDRLKQRVSQLEARLDLLLTITTQQHSPAASPSPSSAVPVTHDDLLRIVRQTLSTDGFSRQMLRFFSLQ